MEQRILRNIKGRIWELCKWDYAADKQSELDAPGSIHYCIAYDCSVCDNH
jgi:hypothetical protein